MEDDDFEIYVGIHWGTETHQVCVLGADGTLRGEKKPEHSGPGLAGLVTWLLELAPATRIAVAIEVPRGPVVEVLLEHGIAVYSINPKQLDRFRDRYTAAGAKDDRRDARVLASSLRTDRIAFRRARLDDPLILRLREVSRLDEELGRELRQLTNQLRDYLLRYFASLLRLNGGADEPWLWSLLAVAPTPAAAARLTLAKLERHLKQHRIRRITADQLYAVLHEAPLPVAPGVADAVAEAVALQVPRIQLVAEQRRTCERRLAALLDELEAASGQNTEHRDVQVLRSLPGAGNRVVATMLGEACDVLRDRNYHALRCISGAAPVTRQTGKERHPGAAPATRQAGRGRALVMMRRGCSRRLRNAVHHLASTHVQHDEAGRQHYRNLRSKGHTHPRAVRAIADRLLGMLVAMLRTGTTYDPTRRRPRPALPEKTPC